MNGALTSSLIAIGITSVVGYAFVTHMQNRSRRPRAKGNDGGGYGSESTSDGFSSGWFSSGDTSNANESGTCASGDSGGGDCGGGGDGGGGGD